jgi:hypothetical protein
MEENQENLTHATYREWEASLFGACLIAFGLGVLLAHAMQPYLWWIILLGILLHGWGMYRIHQRNTAP